MVGRVSELAVAVTPDGLGAAANHLQQNVQHQYRTGANTHTRQTLLLTAATLVYIFWFKIYPLTAPQRNSRDLNLSSLQQTDTLSK